MGDSHRKQVSAEHLEVLGKEASSKWARGEHKTLTDSIVETVKEAGLSPEQVKRVVEFANTDAYLTDFKKEGAHRFIDFGSGGPGDPSDVLSALNMGGRSVQRTYDQGTTDYDNPPSEKNASDDRGDALLAGMFDVPVEVLPLSNPYGEVLSLKDKLAGAYAELGSEIDGLEIGYADDADQLYGHVKQAALEGVSLGQVLSAWTSVAPSAEYAKVAFQLFTPRLLREGVFHRPEELVGSMAKTAASHEIVNPAHPLVLGFKTYCETLQKLAGARAMREEIKAPLGTLNAFFKQASAAEAAGKLIGGAWHGAKGLSAAAGKGVGDVARGAGAHGMGDAAEFAIAHAPHAAALIAANEARLAASRSPTAHGVMSVIPGTPDYRAKNGY